MAAQSRGKACALPADAAVDVLAELSDVGYMLELLGMHQQAGEALILALVALCDEWWFGTARQDGDAAPPPSSPAAVMLLNRVASLLAQVPRADCGRTRGCAAEEWWRLAEAARERLSPAALGDPRGRP
eukprot:CAMPEP_0175466388 /NCGR_PEP_ID=MMETSP0095-20121207/70781_1 /TAXON_ID=311494 /ORGANISM="Alexandrium monilatum, Strain CCMP3105" /LENGTH=128 /DNA_ID=CAMNT_0016767733 /DNA_START=16 /DNA_END=399 /DNA_ORIENTATION=+